MELVFVHGYSVRNTATYGDLPSRLESELARRGHTVRVDHIYLGKYVSFNDQVSLDDLSLAFETAVREKGLKNFACITHSTGGPLVRNWIVRHGGESLSHLIMLAPANHGSALAQLGKGRLSRIKSFIESVEPGQKILDWLELGSEAQWDLNLDWMDYDGPAHGVFPFVLAGQTIDRKLYDHLNSYTGEAGSDGVVRVAAANLNYDYVRLYQQPDGELAPVAWKRSAETPLAILPGMAHGGKTRGIMNSVTMENAHPAMDAILECLDVKTEAGFEALRETFAMRSALVQESERIDRWRSLGRDFSSANPPHTMLCLRVVDDKGALIEDYDAAFTAGEEASPDLLPQGFFRDRQRNSKDKGRLTYYLDHEKLSSVPVGFEITARPTEGLVRYQKASIRPQALGAILRPNETMLVEIVLRRLVDINCFRLSNQLAPEAISDEPSGTTC
jgi:pimeloyl-ACP methyl ester carboxylesterase